MDISCISKVNAIFVLPSKNILYKPHKISIIKCSTTTFKKKSANLYEVLSLESHNVGSGEIKRAYRNMARQYHPDVVPTSRKEESTKRFVEIQKAYETLSNPVSRQKYDYELRLGGGTFSLEEEKLRNFCKDVWENQLEGLRQRPQGRAKRPRGI
ncbi:hypothetical protein ACHQM5_022405 [Ranunculus cassubicifolius]